MALMCRLKLHRMLRSGVTGNRVRVLSLSVSLYQRSSSAYILANVPSKSCEPKGAESSPGSTCCGVSTGVCWSSSCLAWHDTTPSKAHTPNSVATWPVLVKAMWKEVATHPSAPFLLLYHKQQCFIYGAAVDGLRPVYSRSLWLV